MQRARFALVTIVLASMACSPQPPRTPPRTPSHDGVARRDEGDGPGGDDNDEDEGPPHVPPTEGGGPGENQRIRSFAEAKRVLGKIYERHRVDLYCGCPFAPTEGSGYRVDLAACGYAVARDAARASRIEWEHAVPAATFGRTFLEWTEGDDRCVDRKGKRFNGRKCAARVSPEFARMEADLHNLFPVVGEVNGLRGDLPMGILDPPDRTPPHHKKTKDVFVFGACKSTIDRGVFLPRPEVRGDVARAALYMDWAYPSRRWLDDDHRRLFVKWSAEDPPDDWERERNAAIAERQGNANPFISAAAPAGAPID
jgi:deoxyribonuclease-1